MNAKKRTSLSALLAALVVTGFDPCVTSEAWAKRKPEKVQDKALRLKARQIFQRAEKQYNLGRFREALALYAEAYDVVPLPALLFNIGQCHRMLGDYKKAVFFYQGYLRASDAAHRSLVLKLIGRCERRLKEEARRRRKAERKRASSERTGSRPERKKPPVAGRGLISPRPAFAPAIPGEKRRRAAPFYKRWWFWTSITTGVAVAAAAVTGGILLSRSDRSTVLPEGSLGNLDRR